MDCPIHNVEMEVDTVVTDFHDPSDFHGHGQNEQECWICPIDGCDECEPYFLEPEYDED